MFYHRSQAWHRSKPNEFLVMYMDRFMGPNDELDKPIAAQAKQTVKHHRVLVPLCGKTVDMPYLADKGQLLPLVGCCEMFVLA